MVKGEVVCMLPDTSWGREPLPTRLRQRRTYYGLVKRCVSTHTRDAKPELLPGSLIVVRAGRTRIWSPIPRRIISSRS